MILMFGNLGFYLFCMSTMHNRNTKSHTQHYSLENLGEDSSGF